MSSMYSICHYYQVHLPDEAMALQTHGGEAYSPSERVLRHRRQRRKNVIHFIVGKKLGNSVASYLSFILFRSVNCLVALRSRYRAQY